MHISIHRIFSELNLDIQPYLGTALSSYSPVDGALLAQLASDKHTDLPKKITHAEKTFHQWRKVPAPKRAETIRIFAEHLRKHKETLAQLITLESGKILEEGKGEVQEMIDICDYAVGLSRTISGLTLPSEREAHNMEENWLPLGPIAIISAFNFPVAVWAWNVTLATICGNTTLWKPSHKTPLCALACYQLFCRAAHQAKAPEGLAQLVLTADHATSNLLVTDHRIALVSATGSTRMGKQIGHQVAQRFGKTLLELGGNNAAILTPTADLQLALPAIIFGAVGTAGQRCTSTRRLFIHHDIYNSVLKSLKTIYRSLTKKIGNPLHEKTLLGPLIDQAAYQAMEQALQQAQAQGGKMTGGKRILTRDYPDAYYVTPALVCLAEPTAIVHQETFAPILYAMPYQNLSQALILHNAVSHGLSSAIFTKDLREAAFFKQESDCGIANVNIGTSGAEIGGAFGGEKETGGGRESGSDAWKNYMRRQTSTTYYGNTPPELAQGINFSL